ncbi:unnamed protein product [Adineta ricciae]|uniref:Uncharacterized protein n=1 Tax=Adineta ricciae TaxID=249248 RepID=A0A815S0Q6_ADIRI|nr:unnamed protein product [Adineta ricciae]CAF1484485.1 unnamed protein product [Adineta ricciae]
MASGHHYEAIQMDVNEHGFYTIFGSTEIVTTRESSTTRPFSITVYGPTNVSLQRIVDDTTYCYVGGACNTQVKSIDLTLDDILRLEIKRNMTIHEQTFAIRISAALSIIMFTTGVVSSFSTMLTFQNASSRTVGCSLYLLASSATSVLTKRKANALLNGETFTSSVDVTDTLFWCIITYPQSLQDYNTSILFIHLLGPFSINLLSSLLSGCIGVFHYTWLYLCGYFISFTSSILVFVVFVLPSNSYRKTFKESFFRLCKQRQS